MGKTSAESCVDEAGNLPKRSTNKPLSRQQIREILDEHMSKVNFANVNISIQKF